MPPESPESPESHEPRDIAVVLVSHDTRELLLDALASVRGAHELVVVDNASTDRTVEVVRRAFPEATVLESPANDGYGAAANRGMEACSAPFVLLLNSDVVVRPGALRALAGYLESHPRAGLAGPRLENPDGTLQRSCFDFLGTVRLAVEKTALGRWLGGLGGWSVHYGPYDGPRTAPWVLGAALAIRRDAFDDIGGFDPSFFLYGEEVDLCYRMWQAGWEVHYTPSATVEHLGGGSTAAARPEMEVRRVDSARRFYRRHYPPVRAALLDALIRTAMWLRWVRDSLRLRLARDDRRRSRLAEDLAVWRSVLGGLKTD